MSITVSVRLFGDLTRFDHQHRTRLSLELSDGASVATLLEALGAGGLEHIIVGVQGQLASRDTVLAHQDCVELMTPMAGGQ
jgi:molybdopterin converting factor small subunit